MRPAGRRRWRVFLGLSVVAFGIGAFPSAASAHPLGNLSVNQLHELVIQPDRPVDHAVIDTAEIPTAQKCTRVSRRELLGMGVAGGLVPSPSALVVLLSAIARGRTVFGVILVRLWRGHGRHAHAGGHSPRAGPRPLRRPNAGRSGHQGAAAVDSGCVRQPCRAL